MGSVMRKAITNIYDIPEDLIVDAIRRGFSIVRGGDPPCYLEVDVGEGLYLNDRTGGKVTVDNGAGLGFNENKLEVKVGKGLAIDEENKVGVNPVDGLCCCDAGTLNVKTGIGLSIGDDKAVNVNVGPGLFVNPSNQVDFDLVEDPTRETNFTNVKSSTLSVDGPRLLLTKTVTTYLVKRNASGVVLDIVCSDEHTEVDTILMTDSTYGYGGYGHGLITSERKGSQDLPNFYKK